MALNTVDKHRIVVRSSVLPGDLGRVISMHGETYAREYSLDHHFEAYVAESLAVFAKNYNGLRDRLWLAEKDRDLVGSIGIAGQRSDSAQLRWFLVSPQTRGTGLGTSLLEQSIEFCNQAGYRHVFLWTFQKLTAAARMYSNAGFQLTESTEVTEAWGAPVIEQRYDLWF